MEVRRSDRIAERKTARHPHPDFIEREIADQLRTDTRLAATALCAYRVQRIQWATRHQAWCKSGAERDPYRDPAHRSVYSVRAFMVDEHRTAWPCPAPGAPPGNPRPRTPLCQLFDPVPDCTIGSPRASSHAERAIG